MNKEQRDAYSFDAEALMAQYPDMGTYSGCRDLVNDAYRKGLAAGRAPLSDAAPQEPRLPVNTPLYQYPEDSPTFAAMAAAPAAQPATPDAGLSDTQAELDAVTREMDVVYARWPKVKKESDEHRAIREELLTPLRARCVEIGQRRYREVLSRVQAVRKPLTSEQRSELLANAPGDTYMLSFILGVQAAERAHGITGEQQ